MAQITEEELESMVEDKAERKIKALKNEMEMERMSEGGRHRKDIDTNKELGVLVKGIMEKKGARQAAEEMGVEKSVTKDTLETDFSNAGFAIPTPLKGEIVPILDAEPALLEAGPNRIDMPAGKLDVPRHDTDPTVSAQQEGTSTSASNVGGDQLQLSTNKYTGRVDISNDWLNRDAVIGAEYIMDRLVKKAANTIDADLFEGSGSQNTIQGIKNQVDSTNIFASTSNTTGDIVADLKAARNDLDGNDVPENKRAWFMRREVMNDLVFDYESSGGDSFPFREELAEQGTLFGDPVYTTNNISISGSPGDTDIYYVELSEVMVGVSDDMRLDESTHYLFDEDKTVLRLVANMDMVLQHKYAASIVEDYTLQN